MTKRGAKERIEIYLAFARSRPELFSSPEGGVRILMDPVEIREVEQSVARDLLDRGLPEEGAEVGIVLRDPWFVVVRDAVEFPDGARRTHARVINRVGNGAAALPVLNGRIVLARHFRHGVRRWSLEIPRGGIEAGRSAEETARAELQEEIGATARTLRHLGFVHGTTNLYANGAHLYFAELAAVGAPQVGEGITSVEQLEVCEFERLLLAGEIVDGFTVAAFAHARLRGLL